jgi:predicted small lipoprotein YifL
VSKMKIKIMTLLLIVLGFFFCGKKGPLVLEPEKIPLAVTGLKLRQVGTQIELQWKFPSLLSDKKTPLQPAQIRGVAIYHLAKPFSPEAFQKKSELLARPKASELQHRSDGASAYALQFKAKLLKDKEHSFALTYQYGRSHSALSAIEKITTRIPPEPVRDLKSTREGKVVVLKWSRPQADSEGQPLQALAGYRVYRRIQQGKNPDAFEAINEKVVKGEYYEDHDTGADGDYEYQVSSLLNERIESAPSAVTGIKIQDTFPPDIPANLVAFTAKDHVFLTWEAVRDRDLGHYNVYRRSAKDEDFKLLDAAVTDNFYRDRQVVKGQLYIYTIVAVDKKGNESEPSHAVRQFFE